MQHPTGGVVGEVRVNYGDRVKAGDILIRLDETVTRANLAIVTKGLAGLYVRKARLAAERDGTDAVAVPKNLPVASTISRPLMRWGAKESCLICGVRRAGQKDQLRQKIVQLEGQISGFAAQQDAKVKETTLIEQELMGQL